MGSHVLGCPEVSWDTIGMGLAWDVLMCPGTQYRHGIGMGCPEVSWDSLGQNRQSWD